MSICQRSNGSWAVKYKDPTTGAWRQRQFRDRSSAAAFDAQATLAAEKDEPLTVREAVLTYIGSRDLSKRRARMYVSVLRPGGYASLLADRYVDSLNRRDLEALRSRCQASGQKPSTVNFYLSAIAAVFRWCASEDLIRADPWAKYRINIPQTVSHLSGSLEDLLRIYEHLSPWMRWAVQTAMALCLRPGLRELFCLEWPSVDWKTGAVSVYMPKTKRTKVAFAPPWYLEEAWPRYQESLRRGVSYICPSSSWRHVHAQTTYSRPWATACRRAGVYIPFYAIRHIAASEMLAAGADLAAVAAQLGHRDITTTAAFYTHALARAQKGAAGGLPALVGFGGGAEEKIQF